MATLDNPMNAPDPGSVSPWPVSMRYGGIIALILVVFGLVLHLSGISDPANPSGASQVLSCLNYVIMIAGIVMAIKFHRDKELGGYLTLGRGIGTGSLTGLVIGVISAVWMIIFMMFIAPDMSDAIKEAAMSQAQPGQEEMTEKMVGYFTNPYMLAAFSLFGSVLIGFLTGLIGGAILKKEPPTV
jgi:uncharacterized protein YybS (DUF2232 family)